MGQERSSFPLVTLPLHVPMSFFGIAQLQDDFVVGAYGIRLFEPIGWNRNP